jgi:perosamine synthetase
MRIPICAPVFHGRESQYLLECIKTGWISSEGPFVKRFEESFAAAIDRKFGIAVCNGTAALELAVASLNLPAGSEIILPALAIISCPLAVLRNSCVPVLVDSDPRTWNMDVSKIEEKITSKTRAIMAVHLYGLPVDMDPLLKLARRHGLKVIEDAAEMHGQKYKDRPCGSFGEASAFSFYSNKMVAMGEGGLVATNSAGLAKQCRSLRNLCFGSKKRFVHERLGHNFRLSNLQAAVGLAQLEKLEDTVRRKRRIGRWYTERLKTIEGLTLPLAATEYADNIYWMYGIVLDGRAKRNGERMASFLKSQGVETRPFFWPIHRQPALRKRGLFKGETYPAAEHLARNGLCLPSGPSLTEDQVSFVVKAVSDFMRA